MTATAKAKTAPSSKPPEGYQKADDQIQPAGYWLPEAGPIHGKLVGAFEFRQKSGFGKGETRRVYLVDIADSCVANAMHEGPNGKRSVEECELPPRSIVGVFATAALADLDDLAGCFVFINRRPESEKKVLSSGTRMWMYDIAFKGRRSPVKVRQLRSRHEEPEREPGDDADIDDLPF